jgi:hypothetical protein
MEKDGCAVCGDGVAGGWVAKRWIPNAGNGNGRREKSGRAQKGTQPLGRLGDLTHSTALRVILSLLAVSLSNPSNG